MDNFFKTDTIKDEYDTVILGGGPAGCTAGIYASRDNLDAIIFEKKFPGGQVAITHLVENYPGFVEPITGGELAENFYKQALRLGVPIRNGDCTGIELDGEYKILSFSSFEKKIRAKTVIIATGMNPKKLDIEGENRFLGRGISFCATCDGAFYRDKVVAVVGGGDSAIEESIYLTKFATKVYIIHRRDAFRASKSASEKVINHPKIEVLWDTVVDKVGGDASVESLLIRNVKTSETRELAVSGLFEFVGWDASTEVLKGLIDMDESGFIVSDESTLTNVEGIFVAGDVRTKPIKQITTAVSDGSVAGKMAEKYISERF